MNKILMAIAVIVLGIAGYWFSQTSNNSPAEDKVLSHVPADTAFFSGMLTPFPVKSYINSLPEPYKMSSEGWIEELKSEEDVRAKFFLSLLETYMNSLKDGDSFVSTFGLADNIRSYFYVLGLIPVFKVEVANPKAIWTLLDKAEKDSGFTHQQGDIQGLTYRRYLLTNANSNTDVQDASQARAELIIAINDGLLTVTMNTSINDDKTFALALGASTATPSLLGEKTLQQIATAHQFNNHNLSFINHQTLVKALTSLDANELAKQLALLYPLIDSDPFADLRNATCQQELEGIAKNWPRTVMGYDKIAFSDYSADMSARTIIETKNQTILSALQKIKGFIPSYVTDTEKSLFSLGFGVNVGAFSPALKSIWDDLLIPQYQCHELQAMQQSVLEQDPSMLGMFTGMADGVMGMGMSIYDYKLANDVEDLHLTSLDALVTLSAKDPSFLVKMVKPFLPMLANIEIPKDGTPVDLTAVLPIFAQYGIAPKIAIKGHHLVLFSGEQSQAQSQLLANETIQANGLLAISTDYMKMFAPLMAASENSSAALTKELAVFKDYDMKIKMTMDTNSQGILFDTQAQTHAVKP